MNRSTVGVMAALMVVACAAACAQQPPQGQPLQGQPAMGQPAMGQPMMGQPGPGGAGPGMPQMGQKGPGGGRQGGDPMMENFFPPELIMQNQKALGLKEDQQADIRKEMQKTMAKFTDLQWQQSAEAETMAGLMKQDKPDEKQVLAQLDKLMAIESEIKRLNLGMLIRVKNLLTGDQQARLRELRRSSMGPMPGMGGPQGPGGHQAGAEGPRGQPGRLPAPVER